MSVKAGPIEECWQEIVRTSFADGFCCDHHRNLFRGLYFAGAVAAIYKLTGFDPEQPANLLSINIGDLPPILDELIAVQAEADKGPDQVHH